MMAMRQSWQSFRILMEMIKIEHSIFALPYAMLGMMWGSFAKSGVPWPGFEIFGWIVVAMVSCRSAAMAFNRIADRDIDAENPRTVMRALPAGLLQLKQAQLFLYGSIGIFLLAAFMLNPLTLALSPIALLFTLGYSLTKRFTWLCHFVLGLSLGIAPAAAWIGVTGSLSLSIVAITLAVTFWTAGFDILYALADDEFDRSKNLHSVPAKFGRQRAMLISRVSHVVAVGCLLAGGLLLQAGWIYFLGVAVAAGMLIYEQSLVKPNDLSKLNMAFFTLNGYISMGVFLFALIDILVVRQ